jgi:tetratricopeptide (TPR) repeat protein
LFESAVAQAPQFAAGWSSLSLSYEVVRGYTTRTERAPLGDVEAKTREAALKANALDPDAAMTLHAMADVARMEFRYAEAERLFLRSMQADPTYPDVREDYSELLTIVGRHEEALAAAKQLVALEPFVRNFWSRVWNAAISLDRRDEVVAAAARISAIDPTYNDGIAGELALHLAWGRVEPARAALALAVQKDAKVMAEDTVLFAWATRAPDADEAAARRVIADATAVDPTVYFGLRGDADAVFAYFDADDTAFVQRHRFFYNFVSVGAARKYLGDPRTKALLRKYGFEAYWREKGWPASCKPLDDKDFECR